MYILDTDSLAEIFEQGQQTPLGQRAASVPASRLYISVVTVEEMIWGRIDAIKKAVKLSNTDAREMDKILELRWWHDWTVAKLKDWEGRVLPYDEAAHEIYRDRIPQAVRKGRLNDSRIAAVALRHNFTVITKNQKDFIPLREACGVKWDDWSVADPEMRARVPTGNQPPA